MLPSSTVALLLHYSRCPTRCSAARYLSSIHSAPDMTKYSGTSLSMEDTIGTQLAVLYREVSLIQR